MCARVLHQARVHDLLPGLYFYNNVLHLTGIWLEYHSLFQDIYVFLLSSLEV